MWPISSSLMTNQESACDVQFKTTRMKEKDEGTSWKTSVKENSGIEEQNDMKNEDERRKMVA